MASLFYLQINLLSMFFDKSGVLPALNRFSGILTRIHVTKAADSANFHHFGVFICTVIEALTIALCMHAADCQAINFLQTWIRKSD